MNNEQDIKETQTPEQPETNQENQTQMHDSPELQTCHKERDEWKDRCLRTMAEFENFKKRTEKDKQQWITATQSQLLKSVIEIADNFDLAFGSLADKAQDENIKQWITGFKLIHQAFEKLLVQYGVEEMKDYTHFDPSRHEALMEVESADHKSGDIVQVLQKGYLFKGSILRPAKVSVAK
jgi:molecular chaperone GrpE